MRTGGTAGRGHTQGGHRGWIVVVLAALAGPAEARNGRQEAPDARPNLLVLVTDDQRADALGCSGNPVLRTPHMDRLAARGLRFTHAFATTPICAASRASLLTGELERAHGYTFQRPPLPDDVTARTYPALLKRAGYLTGFIGKLGVRLPPGAPERMFDRFHPTSLPYEKEVDGETHHLTDLHAERAVEFLRAVERDVPFCLSVSFHAPHAEDSNPDQYVWPGAEDGLYEDAEVPAPRTSSPEFFEALPQFVRESLNRVRWHWRFDTEEKRRRMVRGYYRMISGVDRAVGRVLAALDELGLAEDTVIVLVSDNGYFLGERGFAGKWTMHDLSTRVPLLVLDPRAAEASRGGVVDELVLNVDLPPTLLELAGVDVPAEMQGTSLVPFLRGERVEWRDEVFTEHLWRFDPIPRTEALRTRRWKFIRYLDHAEYEELYDLARDPDEEVNLARDPRHAERLAEMRERCARAAREFANER